MTGWLKLGTTGSDPRRIEIEPSIAQIAEVEERRRSKFCRSCGAELKGIRSTISVAMPLRTQRRLLFTVPRYRAVQRVATSREDKPASTISFESAAAHDVIPPSVTEATTHQLKEESIKAAEPR